ALEGRDEEAMQQYRSAIAANPANAAAYFNLSQICTRRYDFHGATEALAHASALNFEMLRAYQSQTRTDGTLPLVDQWIAPPVFWTALLQSLPPAGRPLPPWWRDRVELSGPRTTWAMLVTLALGLMLGLFQHRVLPLRRCWNCDRVLCRRCAQRRREVALCSTCAAVESRARAADFARVLLLEHRRRVSRPSRIALTAFAALIPGLGMLAYRRVWGPVTLLAISAALVARALGLAFTFGFQPPIGIA